MRPGEAIGSSIPESEEEIDVFIDALEHRADEVDDDTARDIILVSELLDDASVGQKIGVEPTKLILSALESARFNPDFHDQRVRQRAAEIYEDYCQKAMQAGHW